LTTAVDLLIEEGYPPEAVLLELYMSGELSYTLAKIAELGLVEQTALHSSTSQYGSMTRGMRFILPELRTKMLASLEEIRSGQFAEEWAAEQAAGSPTLETLKAAARSLPLYELEWKLRRKLGDTPALRQVQKQLVPALATPVQPGQQGRVRKGWERLRGLAGQSKGRAAASPEAAPLTKEQMEAVLEMFLAQAAGDPELQAFSQGKMFATHYVLGDPDLEFFMSFEDGQVSAGLGAPASPAEVRLSTRAEVLDGMMTGRINAMRAAMTGQLSFSGDAKLAISVQQIQDDLKRLYRQARQASPAGIP
jgi:putative sterol carrier protein